MQSCTQVGKGSNPTIESGADTVPLRSTSPGEQRDERRAREAGSECSPGLCWPRWRCVASIPLVVFASRPPRERAAESLTDLRPTGRAERGGGAEGVGRRPRADDWQRKRPIVAQAETRPRLGGARAARCASGGGANRPGASLGAGRYDSGRGMHGFGAARCERSSPREDGSAHPGVAAPLRPQMDLGKDEGSLPQPTRKKFVIPLEDEAPPAGAKPLFRSSRNPSTTAPSVPAAPQTYAEYAIAQPPGGAGPTGPTGSEPVKGENPGQTVKTGAKSNSILVSPRQRGNPVLKFVRNVPWEFGEVTPDYVLGQSTCALFLSLRYHNLHPDYIHERLQSLGKSFALRVLLVQVDVSLEQLLTASREDLALCPGLGPQKARRLFDVLHEPFLKVPR
ncbi:excision repair cross-complementing rodent repair deficiency complementation group 1 [Cricetulus griseus]